MEFWFSSCWVVVVLFRTTSAEPDSAAHYTIHRTPASFEQALKTCSLTTLATDQEAARILGLISESGSPGNPTEFTFWVGLRKVKNECGVPTLPLRGFRWTEDGSERSEVSRWREEPLQTCTVVRCAALRGESDGSMVTGWGLISVSCKTQNPFICKHRGNMTRGTPEPPEPVTAGPKPATSEPPTPEPRPTTQKPEPATLEQKPEPDLKPTTEPDRPDRGSDPEPESGSESCQSHLLTGFRSLSEDPNNKSRIQVECWSEVQLELQCSGRPAAWRLLNGAPPNLTAICQRCEGGFLKDPSGVCVDVDECISAPCRRLCLNTPGSFSCVCADENGDHHDEDSEVCAATPTGGGLLAGVLPPVLIGVAALLLLLVVAAVTVKCCLMRRAKRRAAKKEKVAMTNKDGTDPTNEKAAA